VVYGGLNQPRPRSFLYNDEVNAVILGEDFVSQMEAMFQDDVAQSKEMTLVEWRRRGLGTRVKELAAKMWQRWL
jgi:cardiolipin synthase A/B